MNKDHANHEKGPPGNQNPAQHVKRVPMPQRIRSPSLVAPQIPQKTHGRVFILKLTSNSRITPNTIVAGFRNTTREIENKLVSFYRCLRHLYPNNLNNYQMNIYLRGNLVYSEIPSQIILSHFCLNQYLNKWMFKFNNVQVLNCIRISDLVLRQRGFYKNF